MSDSTRADIELSGVTKSYGSIRAVRGIDLSIAPGETVALLGPNGAGKTTTLEMILNLTQPDEGRVSVFGVSPGVAVRSGWVGGMLQSGSLPDHLRVGEIVTLVASYYSDPMGVDEVLELTGTSGIAQRWSTKLSGGQAQRVGLAVALVGNPDLLVLDEPTSGVDVEGRREFWRIMRSVAEKGTTVLFATHYLEEADLNADRVVVMARGGVAVDGSPAEVKTRFGSRTIRATLPDVDVAALRALPNVISAERHGDKINLTSSDTDAALVALLRTFNEARDVEVRGTSLEELFLELTCDDERSDSRQGDIAWSGLTRKESS